MDEENQIINECVTDFLSKNSRRYEALSDVYGLTDESFQKIINKIKQNSDILFKDHSSIIFFYYNIVQASKFNFKKTELYADLLCTFKNEIKSNNTTEYELISICHHFSCLLNFLFNRGFFSIESIVDKSFQSDEIFITFLPEIEKYDSEYAQKKTENILEKDSDNIIEYLKFVKENPEQHLQYRQINYHPSPLHKSIRDDDIELFQSLLSKNNFSINHHIEYSFYERLKMVLNRDMSLIQIAAFYGSINIFKFLIMQKEIDLDENLLSYAYAGFNFEIIHLCEDNKCSLEEVYAQPIMTHRKDLLDYYIENFGDEIEEKDSEVKNLLKNFVYDENNEYEILSYDALSDSLFSLNFDVIKSSLRKIVFILRNYEGDNLRIEGTFFENSSFDFELFKFLYSQRKSRPEKQNWKMHFNSIESIFKINSNDSFKFLFNDYFDKILQMKVLLKGIYFNHEAACFLLDKMINDDDDKDFLDMFRRYFTPINTCWAIEYYNEDLIAKLIQVVPINAEGQINEYVKNFDRFLSLKMMMPLIDRISSFLGKEKMIEFADAFKSLKLENMHNYIMQKINK